MSGSLSGKIQLAPATMAMLGGLLSVLIAGFLVLVLTGHETGSYTLFVAGPLVTTVLAAILGREVKTVGEHVKVVERQTNGLLSQSIADLHEHLDQQTEELLPAPSSPVKNPEASRIPVPREKPPVDVQLPVDDVREAPRR